MPKSPTFLLNGIWPVLSLAFALDLIHSYNTAPGGYAAAYDFAWPWIWGGFSIILGLALLWLRKTMSTGISILLGGALLPCVFFTGIHLSVKKGWVLWANERMQVLYDASAQASEVVYYNLGVSEAQMESFERASFDTNRDTTYFVRLLPSQAHGHNAFAIGLIPSVPRARRKQIRSALSQSPLVFRVYHNVAPKDIPAP